MKHEKTRAWKMILTHQVCMAHSTRPRDVRERVGHRTRKIREHVRHEASGVRENIRHKARRTRDLADCKVNQGTWFIKVLDRLMFGFSPSRHLLVSNDHSLSQTTDSSLVWRLVRESAVSVISRWVNYLLKKAQWLRKI